MCRRQSVRQHIPVHRGIPLFAPTNKYVGRGAGGGDEWERWMEMRGSEKKTQWVRKQTSPSKPFAPCQCTHVGAVEEVPDGQQRGQDAAEGLVFLQLVHPFLQVLQRLCYFLEEHEIAVRKCVRVRLV